MNTNKKTLLAAIPMLMAGTCFAKCDVAAFVWPAYQPEPRWSELGIFKDGVGEWENVYKAEKRFFDDYQGIKPLWGYEDESNPVAVARKIDAATSAGVNVFIYDWYWYGGRPFLENALNNGFLKAPNCERMQFYIMWANHDVTYLWDRTIGGKMKNSVVWPAKVTDEEFHHIVDRWINIYFKKPNYYKINGKPMLMIYSVKNFIKWEGLDKAKERIAYLREAVKKAGFPGIHLQRPETYYDLSIKDELGFDSTTDYNCLMLSGGRLWDKNKPPFEYSEFVDLAIKSYDKAKTEAARTGAVYFPNVTCGWDTNSRYPADDVQLMLHKANPKDFERFLRFARDWAEKNLPDDMPKLITINSWNEWTEGSHLEPSDRFGYGYLNAIWRVFKQEAK